MFTRDDPAALVSLRIRSSACPATPSEAFLLKGYGRTSPGTTVSNSFRVTSQFLLGPPHACPLRRTVRSYLGPARSPAKGKKPSATAAGEIECDSLAMAHAGGLLRGSSSGASGRRSPRLGAGQAGANASLSRDGESPDDTWRVHRTGTRPGRSVRAHCCVSRRAVRQVAGTTVQVRQIVEQEA